ncbi:hypothetical protein [Halomonas sp. QHL1]|uniref:hypothetical protein n=1 Tax=Halomonas sp. QHL1 TaxID=1123773 RepID=UPI0008FCF051|nr:hypothetical protein [Halomonas sp. QHL1]OJA07268.1 hypothetical protein QHL1GM_18675 [Halomonas sp. QHL1]
MKFVRNQFLSMIREIHPVYQRHKYWLSPIKELALKIPSFKRLRDTAIDGRERSSERRKLNVSMVLQDKDASHAVPNLIENTHSRLMHATFEDVVLFYREAVRYNDLQLAVEYFCVWLERHYQDLSNRQLLEYLETLAFSLRSLNGRYISAVPSIDLKHIKSEKISRRARLAYITVLVDNLELKRAETLLEIAVNEKPILLFQTINVLQRKPARVELDATPRLALRDQVLEMLHDSLLKLEVEDTFITLFKMSAQKDNNQLISLAEESIQILPKIDIKEEWVVSLTPLFKAVIRQLISLDRSDIARALLEWIKPVFPESLVDDIETRIAIYHLNDDAAYRYLIEKADHSPTARTLLIPLARDLNDFQTARKFAEEPLVDSAPLRRQIAQKSTVDRLRFLEQTSEINQRVEQPEKPSGYVFLASLNCFNTLAMVAPTLIELKSKGFAVGSLMKGVLDQKPPRAADDVIANLFNSIEHTREDGKVILEWDVDWPNRVVSVEGVNYYQGIYERLSTIFRRATISIEDEPIASTFQSLIRRCDYILRVCKRIENAVEHAGQPIILLGSNSHVAPYSVFRDFALARRIPNLRYVTASVAYENYYSNLGSKTSGSMAVVDMTLHTNCRAPFLAIPERFERWYRDNKDSHEVQKRFEELVAKNRTGSGENVHFSPAAEALNKARNEGRRIVCCFGKILCDLAVPYDGGPAHSDMLDWVHHSIKIARENPQLLLLIKPHPHELRPEIALELTEKLEDILPKDLPENVVILNHAEFNAGDLAQYLDLAVLWNGTACLELTGLGLPVVMCSHFGRHDYPIGLHYPKGRLDYEHMIAKAALASPNPELRKEAMGLLHYMGTKEVAIPNLYSRRPITNDSIGVPTWYMDRVNEYLASGDQYMKIAAERIIEGVNISR